jgi:hypothetical protein
MSKGLPPPESAFDFWLLAVWLGCAVGRLHINEGCAAAKLVDAASVMVLDVLDVLDAAFAVLVASVLLGATLPLEVALLDCSTGVLVATAAELVLEVDVVDESAPIVVTLTP